MTTQPSTYTYESQLPAAALNASFDGKADLDPKTGLLDLRELPTSVTTGLAQAAAAETLAAAAVPAATVGQPGGPAGPLAAGGTLPLAQVGLKAGTGVTLAADGTLSSTASGGGGGGAAGAVASPFLPPKVADFSLGWLGQQAHAVGLLTNSTAVDDAAAGLRLLMVPCSQDQNQLRGLTMPAPAAPYELVAHLRMPSPFLLEYLSYGIGFMTQASRYTDVVAYGVTQVNNVPANVAFRLAWNVSGPGDSACTPLAGATSPTVGAMPIQDCWFRIIDDATNRFFYIGVEGASGPWHLLYSCPRAQDIGVPDAVGVFVSVIEMGNSPPGIGIPVICDYWKLRGLENDPVF